MTKKIFMPVMAEEPWGSTAFVPHVKPVSAIAHIIYPKHPDMMTPAAAGAYLGVKESTLAIWRSTKRYPLPFVKVGRLVQYRKSDLDGFLLSRTVETS